MFRLRYFLQLMQPHALPFRSCPATLSNSECRAASLAVDRGQFVNLAPRFRLPLQRLVEIDRQVDVLLTQHFIFAQTAFGLDSPARKRLYEIAELGFVPGDRIARLDEVQL